MQIGIIGVKFTGKTTLFNVITGAGLPTGQGGVEPHLAVGKVPDPRLAVLTEMFKPKRTVHASCEWVDIPGFQGGAAADGGREGTRFLEHGRKVDALAQVIRCFDGGYGPADPAAELETMALELALADLQIVENRLEKLAKEKTRMGKVANPLEPPMMERFQKQLEDDRPLRDLELNPDEVKLAAGYTFLTLKPMIVVLNLAEGDEAPAETVAAAAGRRGRSRRPVRDRRGGAGRTRTRRGGRVPGRHGRRGTRPEPDDPRRLRRARSAEFLHRRSGRMPGLGRAPRAPPPRRRPASSTRICSAVSSAPRSPPTTT